MARKNIFENIATSMAQSADEVALPLEATRPLMNRERKPPRISSPLGAITESLGAINEKAQRAEEIEKKLAEGQAIVELDPADIDRSFVRDRMAHAPEDHQRLVESIKVSGQQVPILVRPHPERPGRYQVAYGHRRLLAVTEARIKVRAVVRELTDEQLVIAQGQENNERTNLTFIEKARFAARLEEARFGRETIMQALCVDKAALSKMISVATRISADIIDAIGHAPSVGQRRWQEVCDLLTKDKGEKVRKFLVSSGAASLTSDERFEAVFKLLTSKDGAGRQPVDYWVSSAGIRVAKYTQADKKFSLIIDEKAAPQFGQFLLSKMQSLYEEFRQQGLK
ncbi:plasmid partitioning protein RepB [Microvirga puerhi]|uniref:Plasmid partitioning protein RepB n=1 Tax=Microvirga puerhi TaxID=2876078 RepID=A0ABS7VSX0_9HYPH|nr:plasmid partitioning protein RepB [Microvirga puerhi]MBZ6078662.1 plasmid partitioning protein RepB [Microvirga puerhi]